MGVAGGLETFRQNSVIVHLHRLEMNTLMRRQRQKARIGQRFDADSIAPPRQERQYRYQRALGAGTNGDPLRRDAGQTGLKPMRARRTIQSAPPGS